MMIARVIQLFMIILFGSDALIRNFPIEKYHFVRSIQPVKGVNSSREWAAPRKLQASFQMLKDEETSMNDDNVPKLKKRRKKPLPSFEYVKKGKTDVVRTINDAAVNDISDELTENNENEPAVLRNNKYESLQADIAKFKKRKAPEKEASKISNNFKSAFDLVLVADFFVILGFFAWLVIGVIARSAFKNGAVLDQFSALWMPVIQPALGVLMAGTIGSSILQRFERNK